MSDSITRLSVLVASALLVALVAGCSAEPVPGTDSVPSPSTDATSSDSDEPYTSQSSPALLEMPQVRARIDSAVGSTERPI